MLVIAHEGIQGIACFAQAGGIDVHGHWFAQDAEQNHRAAIGIGVLVYGFKSCGRAIGDGDVFAYRE
jgi:hypothetical protein